MNGSRELVKWVFRTTRTSLLSPVFVACWRLRNRIQLCRVYLLFLLRFSIIYHTYLLIKSEFFRVYYFIYELGKKSICPKTRCSITSPGHPAPGLPKPTDRPSLMVSWRRRPHQNVSCPIVVRVSLSLLRGHLSLQWMEVQEKKPTTAMVLQRKTLRKENRDRLVITNYIYINK